MITIYYSILALYSKSLVIDKTFCSLNQKSGERFPKVIFFHIHMISRDHFFLLYITSLATKRKRNKKK